MKRVLVIEDAATIRMFYRITLQGGGDVTALLPRPWATLIGPALRLALDLLADDETLVIAGAPAAALTVNVRASTGPVPLELLALSETV